MSPESTLQIISDFWQAMDPILIHVATITILNTIP